MSNASGLRIMRPVYRRSLGRRTPVLDHADAVLRYVTREEALELVERRRDIGILWHGKRIQCLRIQGPDPGMSGGSHRRPGLGSPHRRETYWNPRGSWHLDRIPAHMRPDFERVLRSVAG